MSQGLYPDMFLSPEEEFEETIRIFFEVADADALAATLLAHGIPCVVKRGLGAASDMLTSNFHDKNIRVNVRAEDVPRAQELLEKLAEEMEPDPESHLREMSDDELWEVVTRPDEWDEASVVQAKLILQSRGVELNTFKVKEARKERVREKAKPETITSTRVLLGYAFSFLSPIVGLFIGLALMLHKKTLPDGKRVYGYNQKTRNDGLGMVIISLVMMAIIFLFSFGIL